MSNSYQYSEIQTTLASCLTLIRSNWRPTPRFAFWGAGTAMERRWLSVDEAATHLGISRDTVYKWMERKAMPARKVG